MGAVEYIPGQYNKRALDAKDARAKYISAVLADKQRPFIWEYFRPGTIPLAGERAWYDEVCFLLARQTKSTYSQNSWIETKGTISIRTGTASIFCILHFPWDSIGPPIFGPR